MKETRFWIYVLGLLFLLVPSRPFAQEIQTVTITMDETSKTQMTFEPKEITVKPGKVQFVLINKAPNNHNVVIKLKNKEVRLVRAVAGKTAKGEPMDLAAGEYEIYCNYTSGGGLHKDKGMTGKLIVK